MSSAPSVYRGKLVLVGNKCCRYCRVELAKPGSNAAFNRPDLTATRDHTHPKCDGGTEWVLACRACNAVKASEPYELFVEYMEREGRRTPWFLRNRRFREFKRAIVELGLEQYRHNKGETSVS